MTMTDTLTLALLLAPTEWCAGQVYRDYSIGVSYRALIRPDPDCLERGGVLRVRKVGTLSTKPLATLPGGLNQFGGLWAWNITQSGSTIPPGQLWTSYSWRWQRWTGSAWQVLR